MAICNKIRFYPRAGLASRMNTVKVYGSNTSATADLAELYTITGAVEGWNERTFPNTTDYRYYVIKGDAAYETDCAELEFHKDSTELVIVNIFSGDRIVGFPASNAFDGSTATETAANDGAAHAWIGVEVAQVTITTTTLPNGVEGVSYNWNLQAAGGSGSITWTLDSGALPAGMLPLPASGSGGGGAPTEMGTFNITVKATDASGNSDTQALTLTVVGRVTTKWSEMGIVPKAGMIAWHHYDENYSANGAIYDFSGNLRHLAQASNPPVLTADVLNGNHGWYFDGAKNPLINADGNVTVKHGFILLAVDEATFAADRGIISGLTIGVALAGQLGNPEFFELTYTSYYKSEVPYGSNDRQAPMSGAFALVEFTFAAGVTMDGIQIGRNLTDDAKRFKGWFVDQILYGEILEDSDRRLVYEYFAMRYNAWSKNAAGLDVFPFQPGWDNDMPSDKLVLVSTSVNGSRKARSKSSTKTSHALTFETRRAEETDAAHAFWKEKYPGTSFIYRDYGYSPAVDSEVNFVSPFGRKRANYHDNTYGFQIEDV